MHRKSALRIIAGFALAVSLVSQPVLSQKPGGGAGGTGGGTVRPTTPTMPTQPNSNIGANPTMGDISRPIFLSGKVQMDDGTAPAELVLIERVCNGNPRAEAYTDSKGRFSFQLGQNQGVLQDASMSSAGGGFGGLGNEGGIGGANRSDTGGFGGMGGGRNGISERDLMGCEIRAALPGFRSDVVNLSGRRAFDNPDLGTIILHRLGNVEGVTISATSLNAPKDAKKSYEKGRDLLKKKKTPE